MRFKRALVAEGEDEEAADARMAEIESCCAGVRSSGRPTRPISPVADDGEAEKRFPAAVEFSRFVLLLLLLTFDAELGLFSSPRLVRAFPFGAILALLLLLLLR